ncbi:hypothetical protein EYV94_15685 [Puteibacter caeruleilacunae]|nr:hypothetical protein EYV94_15685 [Puteibacter caeruleilacunae]
MIADELERRIKDSEGQEQSHVDPVEEYGLTAEELQEVEDLYINEDQGDISMEDYYVDDPENNQD